MSHTRLVEREFFGVHFGARVSGWRSSRSTDESSISHVYLRGCFNRHRLLCLAWRDVFQRHVSDRGACSRPPGTLADSTSPLSHGAPSPLCGAATIRQMVRLERSRGGTPWCRCCIRLAGGSPAAVSAGARRSRLRVSPEMVRLSGASKALRRPYGLARGKRTCGPNAESVNFAAS